MDHFGIQIKDRTNKSKMSQKFCLRKSEMKIRNRDFLCIFLYYQPSLFIELIQFQFRLILVPSEVRRTFFPNSFIYQSI